MTEYFDHYCKKELNKVDASVLVYKHFYLFIYYARKNRSRWKVKI